MAATNPSSVKYFKVKSVIMRFLYIVETILTSIGPVHNCQTYIGRGASRDLLRVLHSKNSIVLYNI
jgi:hypothetical protein